MLAALLLWASTFTGITLTVGDPFYERVWRGSEELLGPVKLGDGLGFWESFRDGLKLSLVGVGISLLVLVSGFVPVVGPLLAIALGIALSGRMLARDLVENPLAARGFDKAAQRLLLEPHARKVHGFGMVCQACFLIPFGGVLIMPAAVAGATALVRDVLPDERRPAYQPGAITAAAGVTAYCSPHALSTSITGTSARPGLGQPVVPAHGGVLVGLALDDAGLLERLEARGDPVARSAGAAHDVAEAGLAEAELAHDEQRPALADELEGGRCRAGSAGQLGEHDLAHGC